MNLTLDNITLYLCVILASTMGYAIQRGGTCTVAAVDEVVTKHSWQRLRSMLEASLWVLGGLLIAKTMHIMPTLPQGFDLSFSVIGGGVLLGLGAYVNRGCVFGTIARLGSGQWAYAATPIGFFLGCVIFQFIFVGATPTPLDNPSPIAQLPTIVAGIAGTLMLIRIILPVLIGQQSLAIWKTETRANLSKRIWSSYSATLIIGITFLFLFVYAGAWAYTDVLAQWAKHNFANVAPHAILLLALFSGALLGGWHTNSWKSSLPTLTEIIRCTVGGILMGFGSMWIPGGNDGLILIGIPLLMPYAWIAFCAMCVSIAAAQLLLQKRSCRVH